MRIVAKSLLAVVFLSASASACINDRELPQHEREFRSQYLSQQYTSATPGPPPPGLKDIGYRVAGLSLLAMGLGTALFRRPAAS